MKVSCQSLAFVLALGFQDSHADFSAASDGIPHPVRSPTPEELDTLPKVGDGPGRPLYALNTVELPEDRTGRHCISLRMDKRTHAVTVDTHERDVNTLAHGCYEDKMSTTGWSNLEVAGTDDTGVPLVVRAWGAGLVEGLLTYDRIREFSANVEDLHKIDLRGEGARNAVERVTRMALIAWEEYAGGDAAHEPEDDLSRQAWAALIQMRGIRDGYNLLAYRAGLIRLSALQVMTMNMHAELPAMVELYGRSEQARAYDRAEHLSPDYMDESHALLQTKLGEVSADSIKQHTLNAVDYNYASAGTEADQQESRTFARWSRHQPGGSAIVKRLGPLGDPDDLLAGHVTNGDYGEMTRIIKTYKLNWKAPVKTVTFSSYPGCISSTDDYFITDTGFVYMSTNLWLPDAGEYALPARTNDGLPAFLRALIATRLATQPRSWARIYGFVNGLAGAKQWLIADYGKLKPGQPIADDTVWLVEAMPRLQEAGDVSQAIRDDAFFEVHGVPHFKRIREAYGLDPNGPGSYEESRRSALLDKAASVETLASAREVLTEAEPSRRGVQIPISPRNDLDPNRPVPAGGIDAKVTSKCLMSKMGMQAKSGPPVTTHGSVFTWQDNEGNELFPGWPHQGLANQWNFEWTSVLPDRLSFPILPADEECDSGEQQR